jgi:PPOX class probable F420-dependent enzyme
MLSEEPVGRLGFLDDSAHPRVLPVTFALHDDALYSAIDRKPKRPGGQPARIRHLRRRPKAALTVDHYADDWDELAWVQVLGNVEVVGVANAADALQALVSKYPQYRLQAPPGPLLRLEPERALCWRASG